MKNMIYSVLGFALTSFLYIQSFAATDTKSEQSPKNTQEGMNAERDASNSNRPQMKKGVAKNVKGRDGKVPTESSKNARPSQLKTQERTDTVE